MTQDSIDTSDSPVIFNIPRWHDSCELYLNFCEDYWRLFTREREKAKYAPPTIDDQDEAAPYHQIENSYGRRFPAIVRAVAGFRSSLASLINTLIPETDLATEGEADQVERAMAECPTWKEALDLALNDINRMKELIRHLRPEWNLATSLQPLEILNLLRKELTRQVQHFEELTRPKLARLSIAPLKQTGYLRFPADRINKAMIEALAPGALKSLPAAYFIPLGSGISFSHAYPFGTGRRSTGKDQLLGVIGLRDEPSESVKKLLRLNFALAVKIHLALWERVYMEASSESVTYVREASPHSSDYVSMTVPRLCDDLGFQRKKGAHKRENRETVIALLKMLTSMELICVYKPPGNVPPLTFRGPLWRRGSLSKGLTRYDDLFAESSIESRQASYRPQAFSYAPGHYYDNHVWRGFNKYVALVPASLVELSYGNKWGVMLGAYLSIIARMNGYRSTKLSCRTLVEKIGLWTIYGKDYPGQMDDILDKAFAELKNLDIIKQYRWTAPRSGSASGRANSALSKYPQTGSVLRVKEWLTQLLVISWPDYIAKRGRLLARRKKKHSKERGKRRQKVLK